MLVNSFNYAAKMKGIIFTKIQTSWTFTKLGVKRLRFFNATLLLDLVCM